MRTYHRPKGLVITIVAFLLFGIFASTLVSAEEPLGPGWVWINMPQTTGEQESQYSVEGESMAMGGEGAILGETAAEAIAELARGLKYDPDLMYQFVHDNIEFEPVWGDVKGAYMTMMDRSGGSYDQASLLIELLKQAVDKPEAPYSITDPTYVYGRISLTDQQAADWLGVPEDAAVIDKLLTNACIQHYEWLDGGIHRGYKIHHFWVKVKIKVKIDGTDYVFDPSVKTHRYYSGIDLDTVLGYDQTTFLNRVKTGAEINVNYVRELNKPNLAADLTTFSSNLVDYINNNRPASQPDEIIGGKQIIPAAKTPLRQSELPYPYTILTFPTTYRTYLCIKLSGIDCCLPSSEIYGRRLTISYTNNKPELRLDGDLQATGNDSVLGDQYDLYFKIDHPRGPDQSATASITAGGFYCIVNGWGNTGPGIVSEHRKILEQKRFDGESDSSEGVLGESFNIVGLTWLAEVAQYSRLAELIADCTITMHHSIGVAGQYTTSPYIDMPACAGTSTSHTNGGTLDVPFIMAFVGQCSAFEYGIVHQLQSTKAVSTVRLLDIANDLTMGSSKCRIFGVTKDNYLDIIGPNGQIRNGTSPYPDSVLDSIKTRFDNIIGDSDKDLFYVMPENGHFGDSDGVWRGYGCVDHYIMSEANQWHSFGYSISGGYNGGYSSYREPLYVPRVANLWSPPQVYKAPWRNTFTYEPINLFTGAYFYDNSDISIGTSGLPMSLELTRQYDSGSRLENGPFGLGWTHNFAIQAKEQSDGFQSLGDDSPIDAAAAIATFYVTYDLLKTSMHDIVNQMTVSLSQKWLTDQMINNVVSVKQGTGSREFVKLPDGSYNPPPGDASILAKNAGNYLLMDKTGNAITFNSDGNVAQWCDSHNNTVDFTYSSGLLSKVNNSFNYSLNFSYSGDHISSVTAKKGTTTVSTVTYGYNGEELQNYTDAESKATTFTYDATNDGQLTQVYYPAESGNILFVTNEYDSLGRVKQQTNANDCTYDYYYSYYRTEEQQPAETPPGETEPQQFSKISYFDKNGNTIAEVDQLGRETIYKYDGQQRKMLENYPTGNSTQYCYDNYQNVIKTIQIPFVDSVSHWSFDEGAGQIAYDSVGENDGQIFGAAWVEGIFDEVLNFDGTDYIDCGKSKVLDFPANKEFCIAAWIKTPGASNYQVIFNKRTTSDGPGYYLSVAQNGLVEAMVRDNASHTASAFSSNTVTDNQWHHVASVFGEGYVQIYIDGQPNGTPVSISSIGDAATLINAFIGKRAYDAEEFFNGSIDEVMVFDKFLSSDEVAAIAGSTGNITEKFTYTYYNVPNQWWVSQVKTYTNPQDHQVAYEYDYEDAGYGTEVGDLMKVTFPKVEVAGLPEDYSPETQFTYNVYGQVSTKTEKITDGEETTTQYEYYPPAEGGGLKSTIVDHGGLNITTTLTYDTAGNIYTTEDPLGNIVTNEYDNMRRLKKTIGPAPFNYETRYEYYPDGKLKTVQVETGVPYEPWQQTTYTYTPTGQKYEVTDTLGNITKYEYDSLDRLCKTTDTENHITKQLYYPDGQLWKVIKVIGLDDDELSETDDIHQVKNTYYDNGQLYSVKDARDNETIYEYDGFARLEKTIYADTTYEQLSYDVSGNITARRTRAEQTINYSYDELNRLKTKTSPSNNITCEYDLANRLINTIDSVGTIHNDYDKAGRVITVTNPDGKIVSYQYDAASNRERLTYPDGAYVTYQYDELNRLEKILDAGSIVLAEYSYDALRRRTASFANGTSAEYDYDIAGRLLSLSNQTNTVDYDFSYNYDSVGNRLDMTANGALHSYDYDDIYRLTNVYYPSGYFEPDTTFNYDKTGNRTSVINGGTTSYTSNNLNQYNSVCGIIGHWKMDDNADNTTVVDSSNNGNNGTAARNTSLLHTDSGNPPYLNGALTFNGTNDYIDVGPVIGTGAYTKVAWVKRTGGTYNNIISSDTASHVLWARFGTGWDFKLAAGHNGSWKLVQDAEPLAVDVWYHVAVTFDPDVDSGKMVLYKNGVPVDSATGVPTQSSSTKTYIGRYSSGYYFKGTIDDVVICNRALTAEEIGTLYHSTMLSYDAAGNMTNDSVNNYTYDAENRLITAVAGGEAITYSYDPSGRRIAKDIGGKVTKYIYDGAQIIAEYDGGDNLLRKFVYGTGIDEPIRMTVVESIADITNDGYVDIGDLRAMADAWLVESGDAGFNYNADLERDGKIDNADVDILSENWIISSPAVVYKAYYYHFDGLGSVIALTDSTGKVVESYRYTVYGQADKISNIGNPYMFTGREYDAETGLYYYRARMYNPGIGRFMQTDPIGYSNGINWYLYCGNNPIVMVDPQGLCRYDNRYNYRSTPASTGWIQTSKSATKNAWADALGIKGKFGRIDTYDTHVLDKEINPYPYAGNPKSTYNEKLWDAVHYSTGLGLGLTVSQTTARTFMETWEMTEPGIMTWWGKSGEYQGRSFYGGGNFEDGLDGIQRDINKGMEGYERGSAVRPYFRPVFRMGISYQPGLLFIYDTYTLGEAIKGP